MTVKLPSVLETMTPAQFDQKWLEKFGDRPLTIGKFWGEHAMCLAAKITNAQVIRHIYQRDPTVLDLGDDVGWTALFHAVCHKRIEAVVTLLELGANPNIASKASIELLITTATSNNGAIPKGATSLWIAAQRTHDVTVAKILLKYGAIVKPKVSKKGQDILDSANRELSTERASLRTAIDKAIQVFPTELLQIIVDYTY